MPDLEAYIAQLTAAARVKPTKEVSDILEAIQKARPEGLTPAQGMAFTLIELASAMDAVVRERDEMRSAILKVGPHLERLQEEPFRNLLLRAASADLRTIYGRTKS